MVLWEKTAGEVVVVVVFFSLARGALPTSLSFFFFFFFFLLSHLAHGRRRGVRPGAGRTRAQDVGAEGGDEGRAVVSDGKGWMEGRGGGRGGGSRGGPRERMGVPARAEKERTHAAPPLPSRSTSPPHTRTPTHARTLARPGSAGPAGRRP